MTLTIPGHVPWDLHRIAVSGRYHDPLHTIETAWSLADVWDAHAVLDALDDASSRED